MAIQTWKTGDLITAQRLNQMIVEAEDGIASVGNEIVLSIDDTYKIIATLKDNNNNPISASGIDLPLATLSEAKEYLELS